MSGRRAQQISVGEENEHRKTEESVVTSESYSWKRGVKCVIYLFLLTGIGINIFLFSFEKDSYLNPKPVIYDDNQLHLP